MTTLSFMTANYVARETGYHVTEGWMQGDDAVNALSLIHISEPTRPY